MKKIIKTKTFLTLTLTLTLAGIAVAANAQSGNQTEFLLSIIRDQGFRCQKVIKMRKKINVNGWNISCFAESYDTKLTKWPYVVVEMPRGWVVVPWKINSELPQRCRASPDMACAAP